MKTVDLVVLCTGVLTYFHARAGTRAGVCSPPAKLWQHTFVTNYTAKNEQLVPS